MRQLRTLAAAIVILGLPLQATASPVTVRYTDTATGYEWAAFTATFGITSDVFSAACPEAHGFICSGDITRSDASVWNVTDWIWASVSDVRTLFDHASDLTAEQVAFDAYQELDGTWASQLIAAVGTTDRGGRLGFVYTRETVQVQYGDFEVPIDGMGHRMNTLSFLPGVGTVGGGGVAAWLYRPDTTSTPEPSTLALIAIGAAILRAKQKT